MRVVIAADHAGVSLKPAVGIHLASRSHQVTDLGTFSEDPVDFPDVVWNACQSVLDGSHERALILCGSGIGACMAANKIPGIRAALVHDAYSAHQSVEHDDANVMCLGAQVVGRAVAMEYIDAFLEAEWHSTPDHVRRVDALRRLEQGKPPSDTARPPA